MLLQNHPHFPLESAMKIKYKYSKWYPNELLTWLIIMAAYPALYYTFLADDCPEDYARSIAEIATISLGTIYAAERITTHLFDAFTRRKKLKGEYIVIRLLIYGFLTLRAFILLKTPGLKMLIPSLVVVIYLVVSKIFSIGWSKITKSEDKSEQNENRS